MKRSLLFPLLLSGLVLAAERSAAQFQRAILKDSVTRLLRVYEDNDGINIFGQSTDDAYTNGTRIDLFYQPARRPHGLLGRLAPGAGEGSIDVYGWGIMQLMYTPEDMSKTAYQSNDYPYSGAIIATHTRYSYNPVKKYDWQTEIVIGALGPLSLARQTQSAIHQLTGFIQPKGWSTQFDNALLLNVNLTWEKQLAEAGNMLQVIGGAQLYAGTMQNGAAIYPLILIGKMNPYFDGLFSQYSAGRDAYGRKRWQIYFVAKPELQYFQTNALLEGGIFSGNQTWQKNNGSPVPVLRHWIPMLAYGGVLSHGNCSVSFLQNVSSTTLKGLYCHDWGNVSLYFGW